MYDYIFRWAAVACRLGGCVRVRSLAGWKFLFESLLRASSLSLRIRVAYVCYTTFCGGIDNDVRYDGVFDHRGYYSLCDPSHIVSLLHSTCPCYSASPSGCSPHYRGDWSCSHTSYRGLLIDRGIKSLRMDALQVTDYYWQCCRDAHPSKHGYAIGRQVGFAKSSLVHSTFLLHCCFYSDACYIV